MLRSWNLGKQTERTGRSVWLVGAWGQPGVKIPGTQCYNGKSIDGAYDRLPKDDLRMATVGQPSVCMLLSRAQVEVGRHGLLRSRSTHCCSMDIGQPVLRRIASGAAAPRVEMACLPTAFGSTGDRCAGADGRCDGPRIGLLILQLGLWRVFSVAPQLQPPQEQPLPETSLTVVIPAYNEADNIATCLESVLGSTPPCVEWQVLVVDDESSDATAALAAACAADHPHTSAGFSLLSAGPRPAGTLGGKNWPAPGRWSRSTVTKAFIDADVQLQADALQRALAQAISDQADLLSLAPRPPAVVWPNGWCNRSWPACWGWVFRSRPPMIPPPMSLSRQDRSCSSAAAPTNGSVPRALAAEVVEDLALARTIKEGGHRLLSARARRR